MSYLVKTVTSLPLSLHLRWEDLRHEWGKRRITLVEWKAPCVLLETLAGGYLLMRGFNPGPTQDYRWLPWSHSVCTAVLWKKNPSYVSQLINKSMDQRGRSVSLEALLGGRGGAIWSGQRHQTVSASQVSLQSFLIGRLQALEQLLRLSPEVTVEAPVTPVTGSQRTKKQPSGHLWFREVSHFNLLLNIVVTMKLCNLLRVYKLQQQQTVMWVHQVHNVGHFKSSVYCPALFNVPDEWVWLTFWPQSEPRRLHHGSLSL